ncbi:MAG: hypothetical protein SGILL_007373 [Bacillariaceae sp.]
MASKTGACGFPDAKREEMMADLIMLGEIDANMMPEAAAAAAATKQSPSSKLILKQQHQEGCLACFQDDDHANLLLCEGCNAEYHTYCLEPPLRQVPLNDWFCSSCQKNGGGGFTVPQFEDDGLDVAVAALPPTFTSRFGEVVWAHYSGFGWWPSFIYDPRYTSGSARELARKNLGRRHLVYFFECHDAPFTVLTNQKLKRWEEGLLEDFHMGKTAAKSSGKLRMQTFQQALQAATLELAKPIEMRMDWNHTELPQTLPTPKKKTPIPIRKKQKRARHVENSSSDDDSSSLKKNGKKRKRKKAPPKPLRGFPLLTHAKGPQVPTKRNLIHALQGVEETTTAKPAAAYGGTARTTNAIVELTEDGDLFIKLLHKPGLPQVRLNDTTLAVVEEDNDDDGKKSGDDYDKNSSSKGTVGQDASSTQSTSSLYRNVGFVKLPSRKTNSFADARKAINKELDDISTQATAKWRFHIPGLGPVARKQEDTMGPMFSFLRRSTLNVNLGDGTLLDPLKVFLVDL